MSTSTRTLKQTTIYDHFQVKQPAMDPQDNCLLLGLSLAVQGKILAFLRPNRLLQFSWTCKKASSVVNAHQGLMPYISAEKVDPPLMSITSIEVRGKLRP